MNHLPSVIWITGLSGAGKTTVASELACRLRPLVPAVVRLDGDELRETLGMVQQSERNHGREARLELGMRYARLCRLVAQPGVCTVVSTISMFHEVHAWNRAHLPNYLEVYLQASLGLLRTRDPKGIYKRYEAGQIRHVAGLDLRVDEPQSPDVLINQTARTTVEMSVASIYEEWLRAAERSSA